MPYIESEAVYARFINRIQPARAQANVRREDRIFRASILTKETVRVGGHVCFRPKPPSMTARLTDQFWLLREKYQNCTEVVKVSVGEGRVWIRDIPSPLPISWFRAISIATATD